MKRGSGGVEGSGEVSNRPLKKTTYESFLLRLALQRGCSSTYCL